MEAYLEYLKNAADFKKRRPVFFLAHCKNRGDNMERVCFCLGDYEYVADDQAERCINRECRKLVLVCHAGGTIWILKHICGVKNTEERLV
jgi:acetone carboxylase gamma subunit